MHFYVSFSFLFFLVCCIVQQAATEYSTLNNRLSLYVDASFCYAVQEILSLSLRWEKLHFWLSKTFSMTISKKGIECARPDLSIMQHD